MWFYKDIRTLLNCDIPTYFGGLKNEVVRHVEEFLYAKKIENQTVRTLGGIKYSKFVARWIEKEYEIDELEKIWVVHLKQYIAHQLKMGHKATYMNNMIKILRAFLSMRTENFIPKRRKTMIMRIKQGTDCALCPADSIRKRRWNRDCLFHGTGSRIRTCKHKHGACLRIHPRHVRPRNRSGRAGNHHDPGHRCTLRRNC